VAEQPPDEPGTVRTLDGHTTEVLARCAHNLSPNSSIQVFVCAWNPSQKEILATGCVFTVDSILIELTGQQPDGSSRNGMVHIWQVPPHDPSSSTLPIMRELVRVQCCTDPNTSVGQDLTSLDWSPDGDLLAVGCLDKIIRVVKVSGEMYFTHVQHQVSIMIYCDARVASLDDRLIGFVEKGPIFATRFSKSGKWLLTSSLDGTACVWDVDQKKIHRQFRCHLGECTFRRSME
jgi:transducin (beta)-like 1